METIQRESASFPARSISLIAALLAAATLVFAMSPGEAGAASPRLFSTPEDALKALHMAAQAKDKAALDQLFGSSAQDLLSGDEVQDAAEFEEFVQHLAEKTNLV